jgi:hypothetical protein
MMPSVIQNASLLLIYFPHKAPLKPSRRHLIRHVANSDLKLKIPPPPNVDEINVRRVSGGRSQPPAVALGIERTRSERKNRTARDNNMWRIRGLEPESGGRRMSRRYYCWYYNWFRRRNNNSITKPTPPAHHSETSPESQPYSSQK